MSIKLIKILLIEDNDADARLIQEYLAEMQYAPSMLNRVKSLSEGFEALHKGVYDILLLDLKLPDSSGLATVTSIINIDPTIPVVVLTGSDDERIAIQALQEGAEDYIAKGQMTGVLLSSSLRYSIERHRIQQELKEKNKELENIVRNFHNIIAVQMEGILIVDEHKQIKYANPVAQDILDIHFDTLCDNPFDYQTEIGKIIDVEISRKKKPNCFVQLRETSLIWEGREARLISIRDITEQKRAEEAIKASEEKFKSILVSSPNAITVTNLNGNIVECNKKTLEMHAYSSREDVIGKNFLLLIAKQDRQIAVEILQKTLAKGALENLEYCLITKDGREFPGELSANVFRDFSGKPVGFVVITKDITERKRVEEALRNSQVALLEAQRIAHIGSWEHNVATGKEMWSNEVFRIFGKDKLIGNTSLEERRRIIHPEDWVKISDAMRNAVKMQTPINLEIRIIHPDGSTHWGWILGNAALDNDKRVFKIFGTLQDITERKRSNEQLALSEKRFRSIFEQAAIGISLTRPDGKISELNQAFANMLDYTVEELRGKNFETITHPDDIPASIELIRCLLAGEQENYHLEKRYIQKNGNVVWASENTTLLRDSDNKPLHLITAIQDFTDRKRTEEALRASEQKFRSFIEQSADGLVLTDELGKISLWNRSAELLFGIGELNAIGKNLWDIQFEFVTDAYKNPQYYETLKANISNALKTGQGDWVNKLREIEIRLPNVEHAIIETVAFSIQTDKGFLLGSVNRDVTEHKRSEMLLQKRLIFERMLAEISGQALIIPNIGNFLERSLETLGKTLEISRVSLYNNKSNEEMVALLKNWIDPEFQSPKYHILKMSPKGAQWIAEQMANNQVKLYVDPDDNFIEVPSLDVPAPNVKTMLIVPLFVDQEYFGFLGLEDARHERIWKGEDIDILRTTATIIAQTISRNKYKEHLEEIVVNRTKQLQTTVEQLEQVIRERQKVQEELLDAKISAESANRAKSEFLANMSHELRTPLNAITGFSQILQDGVAGPVTSEQQDVLGNILESSNHLLTLINEILDLSKIEAGKVELKISTFPLKPFLERCKALFLEKAATKNISLNIKINEEVNSIEADEVKLKQVVYNLLSNAVKYTLTGGDVEILAKKTGEYIQITVSDTGIGIAPVNLPKLFQPFGRIETKYSKGFSGTGLGLHYSKKLVELHNGAIWVESEEGKGSRFHFTIPIKK